MTNENKVDQQPAYVLHQRAYRDTSAIVDFLTRDFGRVTLIAKGIKAKKKQTSVLQPFVPLVVSWQGKGDLKTLTYYEQRGRTITLASNILISALYLNELLIRLLPKFDPIEMLYDDYANALQSLNQSHPLEPLLRRFEKQLLANLGYELNLCIEANTGDPVDEQKRYYFIPDQGPIKSTIEGTGERRSYSGRSLIAFANNDFSDAETLEAAKLITRMALKPLLGSKPLKSRELFLSFKNAKGKA
jgi:DNA repair protein RecO (recombination protein O)